MSNSPIVVDAIVFSAPGEVTVGRYELPQMRDDHLLIRTEYTFVSPGTELRVLAGHYGAAGRFPLIPGYACVGRIIAVGKLAVGYREGDLVTYVPDCSDYSIPMGVASHWGGQASHHLVPAGVAPVLLPAQAELLHYSMSEVLAISLRGIEMAQPQRGETAVVIGQGPIGAFSAALLASRGCRTIVVDLEEARLRRALVAGASAAVNGGDADVEGRVKALCSDGGADIVVESAGVPQTVELAHRLLRPVPQKFRDPLTTAVARWPRLVYQANYLEEIRVNPSSYFAGEGVITLTPADRGTMDRQQAVEVLRRREVDPAHFIDKVVRFQEAPAHYAALRDEKGAIFSVAFDWRAQ